MGKKNKEPVSKKRKSAPSKSGNQPKSKKKAKVTEAIVLLEDSLTTSNAVTVPASTLHSMKELTELTKLSESMLVVGMELLDKTSPLVLIDIVCPNENIRALNHEEIEAHREAFTQKKSTKEDNTGGGAKKKVHKDDEIRKFIVEKAEKALASGGVRIAGSTQQEKMDNKDKDKILVSDFLGYGQTSKGFVVYAYFIGPSLPSPNRAAELRNPKNWIPVHKNHLTYFHKRIRDHKPYLTHVLKFDQASCGEQGNLGITPAYDPRFIMERWLRKEGKTHKPLLREHRPLFEKESDFLVTHYEQPDTPSVLHYFNETKADIMMLDLTADDVVKEEEEERPVRFNVAQDRLRQAENGFRYTDKELCHVTIEEFPSLSRIPLAREIDTNWEEFLHIAKRVHIPETQPMAPEFYTIDPLVLIKQPLMALNMEMLARRLPAILGDEKLHILEADNMKPILDQLGSDGECVEEIKKSTFNYLLSLKAVELMTHEEPPKVKKVFDQRQGELSFKPLDC